MRLMMRVSAPLWASLNGPRFRIGQFCTKLFTKLRLMPPNRHERISLLSRVYESAVTVRGIPLRIGRALYVVDFTSPTSKSLLFSISPGCSSPIQTSNSMQLVRGWSVSGTFDAQSAYLLLYLATRVEPRLHLRGTVLKVGR